MSFVMFLRRPVVWAVGACAAVVVFLLLRPPVISSVVWTAPADDAMSDRLRPGDAAPDFALSAVGGDTVALSGLRGQSALLAFVTAECPYCQQLHEELEAVALDRPLVLICTGEEGARKIRETYSFTYPVLIDSAGAISQAYKTPGVPTVYQIDVEGNVVDLVVGWPSAWDFVRGFLGGQSAQPFRSEDGGKGLATNYRFTTEFSEGF